VNVYAVFGAALTVTYCDLYMPLTPLERMQHEVSCRPPEEQQPEEEAGEHLSIISSYEPAFV